jgi:hypothetical protein
MTWVNLNSGTTFDLHYIYFTDHLTGFVAGNNGIILKTINGGVGIEEKKPEISLNIYPSPATDYIFVETVDHQTLRPLTGSLAIYNLMGQQMILQNLKDRRTEINIGSLPKGLYLVRIINNGITGSGRFIRE